MSKLKKILYKSVISRRKLVRLWMPILPAPILTLSMSLNSIHIRSQRLIVTMTPEEKQTSATNSHHQSPPLYIRQHGY